MLREARGDFKATSGKRGQPDYHFIQTVFGFWLFSLAGYAKKHASKYWTLWA